MSLIEKIEKIVKENPETARAISPLLAATYLSKPEERRISALKGIGVSMLGGIPGGQISSRLIGVSPKAGFLANIAASAPGSILGSTLANLLLAKAVQEKHEKKGEVEFEKDAIFGAALKGFAKKLIRAPGQAYRLGKAGLNVSRIRSPKAGTLSRMLDVGTSVGGGMAKKWSRMPASQKMIGVGLGAGLGSGAIGYGLGSRRSQYY